jgi:ABC-type multidrug transport system fused ATPase/permease subunit
VRLGGQDLRNVQLNNFRRLICYLPRDPALFDGMIASNLLFVRPTATEHELEETMELVGLSGLKASAPNGLRERIGPDGCQLSGGERHRLALARAFLQKPKVWILDEATSCLDPSTELSILRQLRKELGLSTFVVVSHRHSTFTDFTRVLLLSRGCIVRDGNPSLFQPTHSTFSNHR